MTAFQTICCFIGGFVLFIIGSIVVLLIIGFIGITIAEAREKREKQDLYDNRMNGEE